MPSIWHRATRLVCESRALLASELSMPPSSKDECGYVRGRRRDIDSLRGAETRVFAWRGAEGSVPTIRWAPARPGEYGRTEPRSSARGSDVSLASYFDYSDGVDLLRAAAAVRELLVAVGEDPDREGLRETPSRVARAYQEMFAGLFADPDDLLDTTFDEKHHEMILVKDIPAYSMCEHHLVPWYGTVAIGYVPGPSGRITGLSKLARLADLYAKRPQLQERFTSQIADTVHARLEAAGVIVVVQAEHLCMAMRGIRKPGSVTLTSAVRGIFESDGRTRAEALGLILNK